MTFKQLFDVLFTADVPLTKSDKGKTQMTAPAAIDQGWGITAIASWKSGTRSKTLVHVDTDPKGADLEEKSTDSSKVVDPNAELTKGRIVTLILRGEVYAKTQTKS